MRAPTQTIEWWMCFENLSPIASRTSAQDLSRRSLTAANGEVGHGLQVPDDDAWFHSDRIQKRGHLRSYRASSGKSKMLALTSSTGRDDNWGRRSRSHYPCLGRFAKMSDGIFCFAFETDRHDGLRWTEAQCQVRTFVVCYLADVEPAHYATTSWVVAMPTETLERFFLGKLFAVPTYQRDYAWT